jgi:hypothetical protein
VSRLTLLSFVFFRDLEFVSIIYTIAVMFVLKILLVSYLWSIYFKIISTWDKLEVYFKLMASF